MADVESVVKAIVIGAGVMGASAAWALARRGHRVVVLERFQLGHPHGSSHGPSRAFRLGHEDRDYTLLAIESLGCWRELEERAGTRLLCPVGTLEWGEGAEAYRSVLSQCGAPWEELGAAEVKRRFGVSLGREKSALWQRDGGVLAAEGTVAALSRLAVEAGADIRYGVRVHAVDGGSPARVESDGGTLAADVVVLAAGAWLRELARSAGIELPLAVIRRYAAYVRPQRDDLPVLLDVGARSWLLIPPLFGGLGMRIGLPADEEAGETDPDVEPEPSPHRLLEAAHDWLATHLGGAPELMTVEPCLYTRAPDRDFVVARKGSLVFLSACSGRGFKFAPRLARAVVELVEGRSPRLPGDLARRWASAVPARGAG